MKKFFVLSVFWVICCGMVFAASIDVHSPAAGKAYKVGDLMTISWTCNGITSNNVSIYLRNSKGNIVHTLKSSSKCTNSPIYYLIPTSVMPGDYRIRVQDNGSAVYGDSGSFTIDGSIDVLEGSFSINKISCGVTSKKIHTINVLVDYDAKKDFTLCKTISGKCSQDLGSLIVTYKIKNYTWSGGQAVSSETTGCNYACINSCGTFYYPKGTLKSGSSSFIITLYPNSNNDVSAAANCSCEGGWGDEYTHCDYYEPELTVTLTLCTTYQDNGIYYKMVSDSSTGYIYLSKADTQVVGDTDCSSW